MTNYIIMWQRDGREGFEFVNAEDEESAITTWIEKESGWSYDGQLYKMIIVETNNTTKVPLDIFGYYYGEEK